MPTKTKPLPAPSAKGLREPQSITRQVAAFFDPMTLSAVHWRRVVAQAPVVGACVDTLIMQICGLKWELESEDDAAKEKFTLLLNMADNGAGWESLVSRVAEDALTVPFGGAFELGAYPDGEVAWIAHLDAGLMGPTYDEKFPYRQTNPYDALHPKVFGASEVSRVIWRPQTDIAMYGWTKTPCMGCLPAIQGLLRSDRFWQTLLTDSPPAGILDIPGMSDQEARDWLEGWKTMMAGIDALKVPILTGEGRSDSKGTAQFISFGQDATQVQLPELVKRYSEQVCAVFGMNVADLGLFGQELRLAGATKLIELSKRQGLARLLKQFERAINNDVLPDGVTFVWEDVELEDTVRKAAAKNQTATALGTLTTSGAISPNIALAQAIADGIITVDVPEEMLNPPEAPPPAPPQAPPVAQGGAPKSDKGITTSGETKGDQAAAARASPKGLAPLGRGDSTSKIPPRTYPANTPAGRNLAQVIGPAMRGVTNSFTKGRLGDLYDAALDAYTAAAPAQRAGPADDAANAAIDRLLAKADWWKTPNIEGKVVDALAKGYGDTLHEAAQEIQGALYHAGQAPSAQVGFAAQAVADPETLRLLRAQAADLIRNVDEGTKFYVKQAVISGVKEGLGSPAIARGILVDNVRRGVIEKFRGRALSIVNTEMNKAMSGAALAQQQQVGLTKKVWHAVPALACDICLGNMDYGPVPNDFLFDDVFDSGCTAPPAHPNVCLAGETRVMAQGVAAATKRWYKGEFVILRTAGGHDLGCTPNHPILTDRGWVPAGLLVEGGDVVSSLGRQWMAGGHEHDDDVPGRIEEVAEALIRAGKVAAREVPVSAEDFHGDGIGSQVAIVYADSLLGDDVQTVLDQHGCERRLCRRHRQLAGLDGQRRLEERFMARRPAQALPGKLLAPHGVVRGPGKKPALLGRASRVAAPLALAGPADLHAARFEAGLQRIAAYAVPSGEAIKRIAGEIALDEIVHVDRIADWRGHVYNLQTADGFYVADGIVTHNCHCWISFDRGELVDVVTGGAPDYLTGS